MEKFLNFIDRAFNALDYIIVLGGGVLGGYVGWLFLGASESGLFHKGGIMILVVLASMAATAIVWQFMKFFG